MYSRSDLNFAFFEILDRQICEDAGLQPLSGPFPVHPFHGLPVPVARVLHSGKWTEKKTLNPVFDEMP